MCLLTAFLHTVYVVHGQKNSENMKKSKRRVYHDRLIKWFSLLFYIFIRCKNDHLSIQTCFTVHLKGLDVMILQQ